MATTTSSASAIDAADRIPVGIGACLHGEPVRYDGSHRRANDALARLSACFDWRPFCPELAIGLGVPRRPIRLVGAADEPPERWRAVDSATGTGDVAPALRQQAARWLAAQPGLCGHVLVKGSPSCGLERVRRYPPGSVAPVNDGTGMFAAALRAAAPLLPVEEDGRLLDPALCESFVAQVYAYRRWLRLCEAGFSRAALQAFHARHKYLVMSRDVAAYRRLGPLLAATDRPPAEQAGAMMALIMAALRRPATRAGQANALRHIQGYLKRPLDAAAKAELGESIELYRAGAVPLVAPLTLLRHHFRLHPDPYIEQQVFMQPYPEALGLRSRL